MDKRKFIILSFCYLLLTVGLFLYSFTQVDLNLTLSKLSTIQSIEKTFIQLGYFNRPVSTIIYLVLIFLFFLFYIFILWLAMEKKLTGKQFWILAILVTALLFFSYPAFSYDLFNYMFWARIFTHYGLSPYQLRALDFPADSWTRFMHWTHTTYNHGPIFLLISFIPSFLGFDKFILTLFNFKLLGALSFLGSTFFIGKIAQKTLSVDKLAAMSFFAFNPLILIESLVSDHNDSIMLFFALVSLYLLINDKKILSFLLLLVSAGIKFLTIVFVPLYLYFLFKKKNWTLFCKLTIIFYLIGLVPVIYQREPNPWYFIPVLGFASLNYRDKLIRFSFIGLSVGLLLRYAPFLYFGDYKPPVPEIAYWVTILAVAASIFIWFLVQIPFFSKHNKEI